jgi:hypothetical protein
MKRLTKDKSKVTITALAPDADQVEQELKDDPARIPGTIRGFIKYAARLREAAPLIQKGKKRAELEKRTIAETNQKSRREATAKYEKIRKFAGQIIAVDPRLQRASANRLAIKIHKLKPDWSERTIRRALAPQK